MASNLFVMKWSKSFSETDTINSTIEEYGVKTEEAKTTAQTITKAATEVSQNRKDASDSLRSAKQQGAANKQLWKEGSNSRLIQIGTTLILLPEPTPISVIVGSGFVAAGTIQKGIKNQSLYMEDIPKTLKSAFKEIQNQRANLKF